MLNLKINLDAKTVGDLSLALEEIKRLIELGYTSAINPLFDITGDEELEEEL